MKVRFSCILLILAGCAAPGGPSGGAPLDGLLGTYRGSFDSALTETREDDLNFSPCETDDASCLGRYQPLADIVLTVERDRQGALAIAFYQDPSAHRAGKPLDLLGAGCSTRLGPASTPVRHDDHWEFRVPLDVANRLCLGRLRPTSEHHLTVRLFPPADAAPARAEVVIDKSLSDANYLYVKEDGVERRVRIDTENTVREGQQAQYRVCIEDDLGEFDRCVLTDREFRSIGLPLPVPGGVALSYTWWYDLSPDLRATHGRYRLEQYVGRFRQADG